MLVLSDHFGGVNSDFCVNFINQNSFCDIRENTPKSYGMGLSPPLPPYGKIPQFCDFFLGMASLNLGRQVLSQQRKSMISFVILPQVRMTLATRPGKFICVYFLPTTLFTLSSWLDQFSHSWFLLKVFISPPSDLLSRPHCTSRHCLSLPGRSTNNFY